MRTSGAPWRALGSVPPGPAGGDDVRLAHVEGLESRSRPLSEACLDRSFDRSKVGEGGLEPPHPFGHRNLNPAASANSATRPSDRTTVVAGPDHRFGPGPGMQVTRSDTPLNPSWAHRAGNLWETMGLQQFEERLERLVEGTLAKPFRSNLQPVEIGRRLTREMDLHRRVGVRGLIAPNAFAVTLSPADVSRFANFIDALSRELSDAAREHARIEGYSFVGPVEVEIFEGATSRPGRFTVTAEVHESEDGGFLAELVLPDGRRVTVGSEAVVIGRLPECDVVLLGLQREPAPRRAAAEG